MRPFMRFALGSAKKRLYSFATPISIWCRPVPIYSVSVAASLNGQNRPHEATANAAVMQNYYSRTGLMRSEWPRTEWVTKDQWPVWTPKIKIHLPNVMCHHIADDIFAKCPAERPRSAQMCAEHLSLIRTFRHILSRAIGPQWPDRSGSVSLVYRCRHRQRKVSFYESARINRTLTDAAANAPHWRATFCKFLIQACTLDRVMALVLIAQIHCDTMPSSLDIDWVDWRSFSVVALLNILELCSDFYWH